MPISLTRGRHRDLERGETRRDGRKNKTVQESRQKGLGNKALVAPASLREDSW
jgi:hypothetical protein